MADALKIVAESVAVALDFDVPQLGHVLVDDAVAVSEIDDVHGSKDLGKGRKKLRTAFRPSSFFIVFLSYLRPLLDPPRLLLELLEELLLVPLERLLLLELLARLLPLLLRLEELVEVPLERLLLLELLARLFELLLVPLLGRLLLPLFTRLLELLLLPLGRL